MLAWSLVEEPRSRVGVSTLTNAVPVSNSLHVTVLFATWHELQASLVVVSDLVGLTLVPLDSFEV